MILTTNIVNDPQKIKKMFNDEDAPYGETTKPSTRKNCLNIKLYVLKQESPKIFHSVPRTYSLIFFSNNKFRFS